MRRLPLNLLFSFVLILILPIAVSAQSQMGAGDSSLAAIQQKIFSMDKVLWEAYKNHDSQTFEQHMTKDTVMVGPRDGVLSRAEFLKEVSGKECQLRSYELNDPQAARLDDDTVLLTYTAKVEGGCNGNAMPQTSYHSSVYVKQGGEWKLSYHQQTPAMPPQSQSMNK